MRTLAALWATCLLLSLPAQADRAEEAFVSGRFMEAARLAEAEGDADSLGRAARAVLADAVVSGQPETARLREAEMLARRAIAIEPHHVEGRLQLAIALSMQARAMSTREAMKSGYGGMARDLAEGVLRDDPDNAYAHGFLAVWNLEVVRRGGAIGSAFMGASVGKARQHYRAALADGPTDPSIHWQYARALAALDARKYDDAIEQCLERASRETPQTALAELMQARAINFRSFVASHSVAEIERTAAALL